MKRLSLLNLGTLIGLAFVMTGCNSDPAVVPAADSGTQSDAAATDGAVVSTTDAARDAGQDAATGQNIVGIVTTNPDFSILAAAITRAATADADLLPTLQSAGPFTVFAPNNAAFAASTLPLETINTIPASALARILRYHVLTSRVPASAITAGPVTSAADLTLFIGTSGGVKLNGGNTVAGGANVTTADVPASNGIIHIVDRVLLPPDVTDLARYGELTSLVTALGSAGLVDDLEATGPFTVFAPTNAAFAMLATPPTGDALATVLKYHVVAGSVLSTAIPAKAASISNNAYGDPLTLLFSTTGGVRINQASTVTVADLKATNGVVHVVDRVILPLNVVTAATAAGLTSLVTAVGNAAPLPATGGGSPTPLATALTAQAPYTVFAPTNAAFTAASSVTAGLSATQLRDVLLYHVLDTTTFASPVLAAELPAGASTPLRTLNGANAALNTTVTPPTIQGAAITLTDVVVTNGVVHVIGSVIVPPPPG